MDFQKRYRGSTADNDEEILSRLIARLEEDGYCGIPPQEQEEFIRVLTSPAPASEYKSPQRLKQDASQSNKSQPSSTNHHVAGNEKPYESGADAFHPNISIEKRKSRLRHGGLPSFDLL